MEKEITMTSISHAFVEVIRRNKLKNGLPTSDLKSRQALMLFREPTIAEYPMLAHALGQEVKEHVY